MYVKDYEDNETAPQIRYCPFCGEPVTGRDSDGSCHCDACGKVFNVIDIV